MSVLRYRAGASPDDLALDECVVRRASDSIGSHLRLWFYVRCADDQEHWFSVAVAPGSTYSETPRRTWGMTRTAPGTWQVSPSINVLTSRETVGGTHPDESLWHETPQIVGVPDPPPWSVLSQ